MSCSAHLYDHRWARVRSKSTVRRRVSLAAALLWLSAAPLLATTYYVDSQAGNDSASGQSLATPWKTIAKVNASAFQPGDRILFVSGRIWREQLVVPSSGAQGSPIVFDTIGSGSLPVISGADLLPLSAWALDSGNIWRASVALQPNIVIFNGVKGDRRTSKAALVALRNWFWDSSTKALYVYSTVNPGALYTNPGVEIGQRTYGIVISSRSYITLRNLHVNGSNGTYLNAGVHASSWGGTGPHDLNVNHLVVTNSAGTGIALVNSDHSTVDSNQVSYTDWHGILIYQAASAFPVTSGWITNNVVHHSHAYGITTTAPTGAGFFISGLTITGNTVYSNGAGIYLHATNNSRVAGNVGHGNNDRASIGEGYCMGIAGSSHNTFELNHCYSDRTREMEFSQDSLDNGTGSSYNVVRYNVLHDGYGYCFQVSSLNSINNEFYGNLVYNFPKGYAFEMEGPGHKIFGNTIYNVYDGVTMAAEVPANNLSVYNNIFAKVSNYHISVNPGLTGIKIDHNLYETDGAAGAPLQFKWLGTSCDFSSWKAMSGQDGQSTVSEPQFVALSPGASQPASSTSTALSDFQLAPGSPAIDQGLNLGTNYQWVLDPSYSKMPFHVLSQNASSSGWVLGAVGQ